MGKFAAVAMKAAGIGWPNVGWQPPYGWSGDTIAATVHQKTSMVFRETGVAHMYSWGNWYAEKELNDHGVPVRLWPLRPDRMTPEWKNGKRLYKYVLPDGSGVVLPANRVFHVPGWGFDGLIGYSRVTLMRRGLGGAVVASEYGPPALANPAPPRAPLHAPP